MINTVGELIERLKDIPKETRFYGSSCESIFDAYMEVALVKKKGTDNIQGVVLETRMDEELERMLINN